jgi:hypothetical protein
MTSRLDHIDIGREQIGHALRDKILFVPPNQRDYSWKDKHVEDLYSDFQQAVAAKATEYFLGSIVVIPSDAGRLMVVDGQQRLATSLILLAAIRDFFDGAESERGTRFEREYVLASPYKSKELTPHLYLNDRDHEYFYSRVLLPRSNALRKKWESTKAIKQSHQRIDNAAKIAERQVKGIVGQYAKQHLQIEALEKWVDFLEHSARVIWVLVPDESSAYVIFETMNDRGLELSATDLIKNYLFGKAGNNRIEQVKQNWFSMTGALETIAEEEIIRTFVRQYWISRHGVVRSQDLFDALKSRVRTDSDAAALSAEMSNAAARYVALLNPTHSLWNDYSSEAKRAIETLDVLDVKQTRPLLLAALENFDNKEMAKLLTNIVSWAVRLLISGKQGSGPLETLYGTTAQEITSGKLKNASDVSQKMLKEIPTNAQFENDFAVANVSKSSLARYYLRAMERQIRNDKEPYLVPSAELTITLEHIMPEQLSADWSISPEDHEDNVSKIGNLVLLKAGFNSKLKSKGFKDKKSFLAESDLKLTTMAAKYDKWGRDEIQGRQQELAKIAVKTWPL